MSGTMTRWSADLVKVLGATWRQIQRRHPDVPDVVITVGAGRERSAVKLGHFAAAAWQNGTGAVAELFIGGEGLQRGAAELLATLLHEAAHGVALTRKIKDTSRQGRWHNAEFRALAVEVGLTYPADGARPDGYSSLGWSGATLGDDAAARYAGQIERLSAALTAYRVHGGSTGTAGPDEDGEGDSDGASKPRGNVLAECGCADPRKVRMSRKVYAQGPVICGLCREPFADVDQAEQLDETDGELLDEG